MPFDLTASQKNALQIGGVVIGAIGLIYAITHHAAAAATDGTNPIVLGGSSGGSGVAGLNPITGDYGGVAAPTPIVVNPPSIPAVAAVGGGVGNNPSTCCPGLTSVQYTTTLPVGPPPVAPSYLPPDNPSVGFYPSQGPNLFDLAFGQDASEGGGPFQGDIAQSWQFG